MTHIVFAPAGSMTVIPTGGAMRCAMPPLDPANSDTVFVNTGSLPVWVRLGGELGDPALPILPGQPGTVQLLPGLALMFSANPDVLAAGGSLGRVFDDRGAAAASVSLSVMGMPGMLHGADPFDGPPNAPGLTITRGTGTATLTF